MYAKVLLKALNKGTDVNMDGSAYEKITLKQHKDEWQIADLKDTLASLAELDGEPTAGGKAWVSYEVAADKASVHFEAGSGSGGGGGSGDVPGSRTLSFSKSQINSAAAVQFSIPEGTPSCTIDVYLDGTQVISYTKGMPGADSYNRRISDMGSGAQALWASASSISVSTTLGPDTYGAIINQIFDSFALPST